MRITPGLVLPVLAICACATPARAVAAHVTTVPGPFEATPAFVVHYTGSGETHTTFHSEPSDGGGKHDTNDAKDSSTERWALTFTQHVRIPECGAAPDGSDACDSIAGPSGATGSSSATGRIHHRHLDGLFKADYYHIACSVRSRTPAGRTLQASIRMTYVAAAQAVALTALDPVLDAITDLPSACPHQGDAFDGLANSYFAPGFSFSSTHTTDRWFTSATVMLPVATLQRSQTIAVRLGNTVQGTPPAGCAVLNPSNERCRTGGSWRGELVLRATS